MHIRTFRALLFRQENKQNKIKRLVRPEESWMRCRYGVQFRISNCPIGGQMRLCDLSRSQWNKTAVRRKPSKWKWNR